MTGRAVEYPHFERKCETNETILEVQNLTRKGHYEDISFAIRPGDIFGITGLLGSGRTELAMSLFGLNKPDSGKMVVKGKGVSITSPMLAKKLGIALLPEDRFTQGLFMNRSIKENTSASVISKISKRGILDNKAEMDLAEKYVQQMKVRTPSIETKAGTLSGGNQQKVVIGKWIAMNPKVFIMDNPTVGIDIGSKAEIYEQIHQFAEQGMAIILISDEIPELMANCNRVMVMANGTEAKWSRKGNQ